MLSAARPSCYFGKPREEVLFLIPPMTPSLFIGSYEVQSFTDTVISVKSMGMVVSSSHLIVPQVGLRSDNYEGGEKMGYNRADLIS